MSTAAKLSSIAPIHEIEVLLEEKNNEILWSKLSIWGKVKWSILMTLSKANETSVKTSPAIIALALSLIIQTVVVVWWAAGLSKDNSANMEKIKELQSTIETQKVYIDSTREKFIKMEAIVNNMQNEKSLEDLLLKQKAGGK